MSGRVGGCWAVLHNGKKMLVLKIEINKVKYKSGLEKKLLVMSFFNSMVATKVINYTYCYKSSPYVPMSISSLFRHVKWNKNCCTTILKY